MKKEDKRGSHVGIMLSFGIFVVFLVFLYSVLQPIIRIEQNKILILNDLTQEIANALDVGSANYTSGSIRTSNANFVAEITALSNQYDSNYGGLKQELKVTRDNEFGFGFIDENDIEIIPEKSVPQSVNVYAKKIPVYYMEEGEGVLLGFIILKIW